MLKNNDGYVLLTTLLLVFIISLAITTIYSTGIIEYRSSNNNVANSLAFQAAENGIEKSISNIQVSKVEMTKILNLDSNDGKLACIDNDGTLQSSGCSQIFMNEEKTIKSSNNITRRSGECVSFGNSDQASGCFIIEGIGEIPGIGLKIINKQEIKINTVNLNTNGVYEY
jgi:Tfp pilus assembly protein PilX